MANLVTFLEKLEDLQHDLESTIINVDKEHDREKEELCKILEYLLDIRQSIFDKSIWLLEGGDGLEKISQDKIKHDVDIGILCGSYCTFHSIRGCNECMLATKKPFYEK